MTDYTARLYFTRAEFDGEIIAIRHGETGYYSTDIRDMDHAAVLNTRLGNTPAMIEAALMCSMFDQWDRFDLYVERFNDLAPPASVGATVTENGHGTG